MKHIYLYGASDDCREIETDFNKGFESYGDIEIRSGAYVMLAKYQYDGDWGVRLEGDIPPDWIVKSISGNAHSDFRYDDHAGQFLHIQIPYDCLPVFSDSKQDVEED